MRGARTMQIRRIGRSRSGWLPADYRLPHAAPAEPRDHPDRSPASPQGFGIALSGTRADPPKCSLDASILCDPVEKRDGTPFLRVTGSEIAAGLTAPV